MKGTHNNNREFLDKKIDNYQPQSNYYHHTKNNNAHNQQQFNSTTFHDQ